MKTDTAFRTATSSDFNVIRQLFDELDADAICSQPEHFQRGERTDEYLSSIISSENSDFILSVSDGKITGFSLIFMKEVKGLSLLVPCKYAYIQDFVVSESMRSKGIGSKLISESKYWAKQHGAEYLRLSVLPDNERGRKFYTQNGLHDQMVTMESTL